MSKNKMTNDEFDAAICAAFPNLYRNRHADMRRTCMCWGFEIPQSWQQLVWDLSEKLEAMILQLPEEDREHYCASQVKSKFAGLRFYMESATDEMYDLIHEAERVSERTCEECGQPGEIYGGVWLTCYCEDCAKSHNLFVKTRDVW